jgi:hypothetical protein
MSTKIPGADLTIENVHDGPVEHGVAGPPQARGRLHRAVRSGVASSNSCRIVRACEAHLSIICTPMFARMRYRSDRPCLSLATGRRGLADDGSGLAASLPTARRTRRDVAARRLPDRHAALREASAGATDFRCGRDDPLENDWRARHALCHAFAPRNAMRDRVWLITACNGQAHRAPSSYDAAVRRRARLCGE